MTHKLVKCLGHPVELPVGEPRVKRQRERPLDGCIRPREWALARVGAKAVERVRADLALDPPGAQPGQHRVAAVDLDHVGLEPVAVAGVRMGQHDVEPGQPLRVSRSDALVRRVELVEKDDLSWAKQPYHAAERLSAPDARVLVERGVASARRIAVREIRMAVARAGEAGDDVAGCAVLAGAPMPEWTVDEILSVHFRMHKAEGVLFRDALARAARTCALQLVEVPEKQLDQHAARALATSLTGARKTIAALGRSVGAPWGKDQKDATLAAMIALHMARDDHSH